MTMTTSEALGIHCLHPGAYMQCASWLVRGPGGGIVVDPGSGVAEEAILRRAAHLGCRPHDLTHVLITHCHCDHAMGAGSLRRFGTRVVASKQTAHLLETADPVIWGEHPDLIPCTPVDIAVGDGEAIDAAGLRIVCIHTPGHTRGSTTYVVAAPDGRIGFTGDIILHQGQPGWAGAGEYDPEATLNSLQKLRMLKLTRVYPGHGDPIEDVDAWLRIGLAEGHAGRWHPTTAWQAMAVPDGLALGNA
jgi:glyoxylase-like metal-dependent hydrolase (beta-lactamase superfamily II)